MSIGVIIRTQVAKIMNSGRSNREDVDPIADAEPPVVLPPWEDTQWDEVGKRSVGSLKDPSPLEELSEWLQERLGRESYGAPRVFDLFTLLAVTVAFALMFAALRLLEPLLLADWPTVALVLASYVTLIAIAQLGLWGGNQPRLASLVAGPFACLAIAIAMIVYRGTATFEVVTGTILLCMLGVPAGYLAGAVVAGVFLLADLFRRRFFPENNPREKEESIWDED